MKTLKRNAVIIAVLLFVCAAVYLNWSYNQEEQVISDDVSDAVTDVNGAETNGTVESGGEIEGDTLTESGGELFYSSAEEATSISTELKEYFDTVRLNRKQARDEAAQTLNTVADLEGASQDAIDSAIEQMSVIAAWTLQESELENLILSKGFLDCVAYISEDGITVTVASQNDISSVDVAKITDIVLTETDFTADQLKIIEKK